MTLTDAQLRRLSQGRKLNPPSFYNADTGVFEQIDPETEDALILVGSAVKQKAAKYLDLLLEAHPEKDDHDKLTARMATQQISNLGAALDELQPVISDFAAFKDDLLGRGSREQLYVEGMEPLLHSLLRGVGGIRNRINAGEFQRRISRHAEAKHAANLTGAMRKEWRSWKRVILAYP